MVEEAKGGMRTMFQVKNAPQKIEAIREKKNGVEIVEVGIKSDKNSPKGFNSRLTELANSKLQHYIIESHE